MLVKVDVSADVNPDVRLDVAFAASRSARDATRLLLVAEVA